MGRRDLLFGVLILGGLAAMGSSLAPPKARPTSTGMPRVEPDGFRATVDRVDAALESEQGPPIAPMAPDLAVLRRMTLALAGSVPSLEEIRAFEALPAEGRLDAWVDRLLADRRTADYLAERLARAFVGVEGGPFLVYRRRRFVAWLSDELLRNRPYDDLVRELIAGQGLWTDHPGTNFISVAHDPDKKAPDPERLAARTARAFLGARIDCAQCHNHPFQPWKQADFRGLTAFYGQVGSSLRGIYDGSGDFAVDDDHDGQMTPIEPRVPFLAELDPKAGTRRERLARWATDPKNARFAQAAANRAWALMFGKPLVEPVDDLAAVPELPGALVALADDFSGHGHDFRRLLRVIAATRAFRLDSATPDDPGPSVEAGWEAFPITRLRPEQVAGALLQSASVETIDADSHLLVRIATQGGVDEFVRRHGDPGAAETDLEPVATIPQRLLMMNGDLVHRKVKEDPGNASARIAVLAPDDAQAIEAAYLCALTRRPTPEELAHFRSRIGETSGPERQARLADLFWALTNASEFSWNH